MCTLVVVRGVRNDFPLVVAANRDEIYARPAHGPRVEGGVVLSGLDEIAGGTWMGATKAGVVVAITNHRTLHVADRTLKSRGPVVYEALRIGEPEAIARYLRSLDAREYNPFNLLFGDARSLRCAYAREHVAEIEFEEVPTGVHVVPNDRLDAPHFSKVARAKDAITPSLGKSWGDFDRALRENLADHRTPPTEEVIVPEDSVLPRDLVCSLEATCVHTPIFGTRSSTLAFFADRGLASYRVSEGPSCTHPFVDVLA